MNVHNLCLGLLNHEITQALACGKRISFSHSKDLLLTFGALHLFVVSGTHLYFLKHVLKSFTVFKNNSWIIQTFLVLFVCACNFSAPILRVFLQQFLQEHEKKSLRKTPKILLAFSSYCVCFPFCLAFGSLASLNLSFLFGLLILTINKASSCWFIIKLYTLSLPLFFTVLGLPHFMSLLATPLLTVFMGSALMPLSFLSLVSGGFEQLAMSFWWMLIDFMSFFEVFLGLPEKPILKAHHFKNQSLTLFNLGFFFFYSIGGVSWRRRSYSF